jgi:magnesium chelatase subunit D
MKDRLALWLDERAPDLYADLDDAPDAQAVARAREIFASTDCAPDDVASLVETAAVFGIDSARACLFALRAARACAALDGRSLTSQSDLVAAVKLTLSPRARQLPPAEPESEAPEPQDAGDEGRCETPPDRGEADETTQTPDAPGDQLAERCVRLCRRIF